MGNNICTTKTEACAWALVAVVVFVLFVVIALCCFNNNVIVQPFTNLKRADFPTPLVYPKQLLSVPGSCKPYTGCFFPSTQSNPINLNTGKRYRAEGTDKIWCEVSWRDCNMFQDCENGKCVPKKNVYPSIKNIGHK